MGKPYWPDLRERVVKAVAQDGLSRRQATERFGGFCRKFGRPIRLMYVCSATVSAASM
jgi:transposase